MSDHQSHLVHYNTHRLLLLGIGPSRDEPGAAELGAEEALAVVEGGGEAGAQVEAAVTLQERGTKRGLSARNRPSMLVFA